MAFQKATRQQSRARVAIDGPAKAGKSCTALRLAYCLGSKVAAIDTEFGSLSKYVFDQYDGRSFTFDVNELRTDFSPSAYIAAIKDAERSGYEVLVIDSLSHAWIGEGGILDQKDKSTDRNSFTAWAKLTPQQRKLVDTILASPMHIICTMRSKMEYDLVEEVNERGRKVRVPVKIGLAPVQREGMEYEFDLLISMDQDHVARVSGSRCPAIDKATCMKPGADFFAPYVEWLQVGTPLPPPAVVNYVHPEQVARITGLLTDTNRDAVFNWTKLTYSVANWSDLTEQQANEVESKLKEAAAKRAATNGSANGTTEGKELVTA